MNTGLNEVAQVLLVFFYNFMSSAKDLMYPQKFYWTIKEPTRTIKELLGQYWNS